MRLSVERSGKYKAKLDARLQVLIYNRYKFPYTNTYMCRHTQNHTLICFESTKEVSIERCRHLELDAAGRRMYREGQPSGVRCSRETHIVHPQTTALAGGLLVYTYNVQLRFVKGFYPVLLCIGAPAGGAADLAVVDDSNIHIL